MRQGLAGLLLLLACLPRAGAEPQEIASSLTLEQVVSEARQRNPQIRALDEQWQAARERPVQARTLPNPSFQYGGMDATDGGTFPDTNEKRYMIAQEFPWFGKLGLRGKVAEKDAEVIHRTRETIDRDVIMQVKETYFDLYAVQQAEAITRAEEDVLKRLETVAETRYSTGLASQTDVLKAQAEITLLKQKLLELAARETTLKARLNQLMDRPADSPLGLAVTTPSVEIKASAPALFALAGKNRPEIQAAQAAIDRDEYNRQLQRREFYPDYQLGIQYRSSRSGDDMVMMTIGFELPIWQTKYRAAEREAQHLVESSQAALDAEEKQVSYDVQDARFKLVTAQRSLDLYQNALIPQAAARFNASEASYRTGKVDFLDLLESERFLLNARVMAAMAEGDLGSQWARLERAVGTDLTKREDRK